MRLTKSVRFGAVLRATTALAAAIGLILSAAVPAASAATSPGYVENGYANPVSAFQPVPRPGSRACTVTAMQHDFANSYSTGDYIGTLTPPGACAGPWTKVVLDWYGSVQGVQYDRLAGVWIGGAEVLRTSTPEPDAAGISWHVDRDISAYIPLLTKTQPLDVSLGNVVNSTYTGVYHITLKITYYMADRVNPPAQTANEVLPLSNTDPNGTADWWDLGKGRTASVTKTFPTNVTNASIEIYARGNGCEEFWYSNVPDDDATDAADGYCTGGTYREVGVEVDGRLAGIAQAYPVIYSGGINPLMWRPIMSVDSLRTEPYRLDLTPFAGLLSDGNQHTITLVPPAGISDVWMLDATLFLTTDAHRARTGGAVTQDTIATAPNLNTEISSPAAGTDVITTTGSRDWSVSGYVDTSRGRVVTTVSQHMTYRNLDKIWGGGDYQTVDQQDQGYTQLETNGRAQRQTWNYPISVDSSYVPDSTGSGFLLTAKVSQARFTSTEAEIGRSGRWLTTATVADQVHANGVLQRADDGSNIQADGQDSEDYQSTAPGSPCFHHVIEADHGQITADRYPRCGD